VFDSGHASAVANPPCRGRFVASHALLWWLGAPLLGAAVAPGAVWVSHVRAPLLIFPLLFGCGLGIALVAIMRAASIGHRPTLVVGAAIAALVAVVGQHYYSYLDTRAALLARNKEGISLAQFPEMVPPAAKSFSGYMQRQAARGRPVSFYGFPERSLRGAAAWASWAIDGLLVLISTVAIVYLFSRSPYCSDCRSWYRIVRQGRLRGEAAARLAETGTLRISYPIAAARYRLSHCASGCGPARLEMTWDDPERRAAHGEAWLDAARRECVVRVLDEERRT
jgi:hypothetical protein